MNETGRAPAAPMRLSVPPRLRALPRPLEPDERASLLAIADRLIPGDDEHTAPSATDGFPAALERSLLARIDACDGILAFARSLSGARPEVIDAELRRAHAHEPATFHAVSSVLAGAYFQLPEVLARVPYPAVHRDVARIDEVVEDIESGILDPVIARGPTYVVTDDTRSPA
jgi:hypothetical protein